MPDLVSPLSVPSRFCGPTTSGNGGWTAGALAAYLVPGPVRVTLRKPPPLDTPLTVSLDGGAAIASQDGVTVGEAVLVDADPVPVEPVDAATARAAEATYAGLRSHAFPSCFACGPGRDVGDGLRIFPGRVAKDSHDLARVAATWTPDPSLGTDVVSLPVAWAALDCVGGWAGDLEDRMMVLGMMTAHVLALPVIGEEHVVVGMARRSEGRRTWTASTLYAPDGRVLGTAEHVWVAVDPSAFR